MKTKVAMCSVISALRKLQEEDHEFKVRLSYGAGNL